MDKKYSNDDLLIFEDDQNNEAPMTFKGSYKVLIADDDPNIHTVTKMALSKFVFEGHNLHFIDAYSEQETKKILREENNIAVAFIDVIMESDHSGLSLVKHIRDQLKDKFMRIIIRTGQPGLAPEDEIIEAYDINDYKAKTELTVQKLYAAMYSCLRSYRDLIALDKQKEGLKKVIKATSNLYQYPDFKDLLKGILLQLNAIQDDADAVFLRNNQYQKADGFILSDKYEQYEIVVASGAYDKMTGKPYHEVNHIITEEDINYLTKKGSPGLLEKENYYIAYHRSSFGSDNFFFVNRRNKPVEEELVNLFMENTSKALDNVFLYQEIIDSEQEAIELLGQLIELDTDQHSLHAKKVADVASLLAFERTGNKKFSITVEVASALHDIGRLPSLRNSQSNDLSKQESYEAHTTDGYLLLSRSKNLLLQTAARIALSHHEHWDGSGFPNGATGDEIPLEARIVSVADQFDHLLNRGNAGKPISFEEAVNKLVEGEETKFDPDIIDLFIKNIDQIRQIYSKK